MKINWFVTGSMLAALAVITGAFGAHGLKNLVDERAIANWDTASRYHIIHAIGLILYALLSEKSIVKGRAVWAARFFLFGIIFFSGSLYLLSVRSLLSLPTSWIGPITPLGGLCFILGWIWIAWSVRSDK
jgi:uncharacterized membrane protein YgdD (TMEM256/DUF423 family)